MLRRRFPRRQGVIARLVGQPVNPLFQEANRCLEMGNYAQAAAIFEQLAHTARPRNAGHLYVEAGRAHLLAGQVQPAVLLFRRGLELLSERGRWVAVSRLGERVVQALRERGENEQADSFSAWLRGQPVPEQLSGEQDRPAAPARVPRLPLKCPSCGGALDPRDVEWVDQFIVECDYCGSLVQAEER